MGTQSKTAPAGDRRGFENVQLAGERSHNSQTSDGSQQALIGDLQKNKREVLRVQLREYKGVDVADIRVHFYHEESRELRPTSRGVSIKSALLPELIGLLQKAEAAARELGLL